MNIINSPIIVDLGKTNDKDVEHMRRGGGPLVEDVREVINKIRTAAGPVPAGTVFVPVVVVYSRLEAQEDEIALEVWKDDSGRHEP